MGKKQSIKQMVEIFLTFFKIGCFTFGGGHAMIPLIEKEVVSSKKWVDKKEIVDLFAVSQSIPGAVAVNSSAFVGYKTAGRKGAVAAVAGVILPSFIIIMIIATFFSKFQNNVMVQRAFLGIRSAVVGLIVLAAWKVGKVAVKDKLTVGIMVLTVIAVFIAKLHPIVTIIAGSLIGLCIYYVFPEKIKQFTWEGDGKSDLS